MIAIRPSRASDADSLAALFVELEEFHKSAIVPAYADVARSLAALAPGVEFLVAEDGGKLVGLASFGTLYPTINARSQFYLKELCL